MVNPLVYASGVWTVESVRIGDVRFNRMRSINGKLDINGSGNNAYIAISN